MKKEFSILIMLSALLGSSLTGYFLTRPGGGGTDILNRQSATLGRFSGDLNGGQASTLPIPDGLFQISTDAALSPAADADGSIVYYHAENGFVSRVEIESRRNILVSQTALPGLRNIIWSPDRQKVVTVFSGPQGLVFQYFDYRSYAHGDLPNVTDAAFSPDNNRLALVQQTGNGSNIVLAGTDGSNPVTILKTRLSHASVVWQSEKTLSLITRDDTGVFNMYLLSDGGALTKVIDGETRLKAAWSPDGSKLLYSTAESGLTILDPMAGSRTQQNLAAEADLCAWRPGNQRIICAVDDRGTTRIEEFEPGQASRSVASELIISPEKIFLSSDEKFLVLLSQSDHSLYGLRMTTGD